MSLKCIILDPEKFFEYMGVKKNKGDVVSLDPKEANICRKENIVELTKMQERLLEKKQIPKAVPGNEFLILKQEIASSDNWLLTAEKIVKNRLYFDHMKIWWCWIPTEFYWKKMDDTDIMNLVDGDGENSKRTLQERNMIIDALQRKGRLLTPKVPKSTWIQFKNKIVDIETDEIFDSSPEYFFTNPIPWELGETEDTPIMDAIFEQWVVGKGQDKTWSTTLFEIIAFGLYREYFLHRVFCLHGPGSNGKTKYLDLITKFFGLKNICSSELDLIKDNRFEASRLYQKLLCLMGETNYGRFDKTQLFKKITGEDLLRREEKFKGQEDFQNYAKIIIATNSLPDTGDQTAGFFRRWLIIDFPNEFTEKIDIVETVPDVEYRNLGKKCIRILKELLKKREFTNEGTIQIRRERFTDRSEPLGKFIRDECTEGPDEKVPFWQFKERAMLFLKASKHRLMSPNEISKYVNGKGFETKLMKGKKQDGTETTWMYIFGLNFKENKDKTMTEKKDDSAQKKIKNDNEKWE